MRVSNRTAFLKDADEYPGTKGCAKAAFRLTSLPFRPYLLHPHPLQGGLEQGAILCVSSIACYWADLYLNQ